MEMVYRGLTLATRNQASAKLECVAHARFAFPTQVAANPAARPQKRYLEDRGHRARQMAKSVGVRSTGLLMEEGLRYFSEALVQGPFRILSTVTDVI